VVSAMAKAETKRSLLMVPPGSWRMPSIMCPERGRGQAVFRDASLARLETLDEPSKRFSRSARIRLVQSDFQRVFRRYVALGDSSTEGLDDPDPRGGYRGWANRLADWIATAQGPERPLLYA